MRSVRHLPLLLLTLLCYSAAPLTQPTPTTPSEIDFKALLGDPPVDGSPEQQREIEAMLQLQAHRTPQEVVRCQAVASGTPFWFGASAVGSWFQEQDLPLTAEVMRDASHLDGLIIKAKNTWNRRRPFVADSRIQPCVRIGGFSYPSGHASRGTIWALVLAEIFPEHRDALLARGRQFGTDRTLSGVHYPSDVVAGQKLGAVIASRLLADPAFRAKVEAAKRECHSGFTRHWPAPWVLLTLLIVVGFASLALRWHLQRRRNGRSAPS
jgi:acid phosphatase (class A)